MKKRWKMLLWVLTILCCAAFAVYCFYSGTIADHNAPKITISEETIAMSVYDEQDTLLKNATAWDEEDGNVTGSMVIESVSDIFDNNMATVTYAAFDQAGNVAKAQCSVVYQDYEGPRFSLTAPLMFRGNSYFNVFNAIEAQDTIKAEEKKAETLNAREVKAFRKWIAETGIDESKLCAGCKVESLEQLTLGKYRNILDNADKAKETWSK